MKRKKKIIMIFLCCFLLGAYLIASSIYVSNKVHTIVQSSYDNYGRDNPFQEIVSDDIYKKISYRNRHSDMTEHDPFATERNSLSFPITYFWGGKAKTTYKYSYSVYNGNGECVGGSWNVPVYFILRLENGKWVVTDFHEPP